MKMLEIQVYHELFFLMHLFLNGFEVLRSFDSQFNSESVSILVWLSSLRLFLLRPDQKDSGI
jgi:hypothetical protein